MSGEVAAVMLASQIITFRWGWPHGLTSLIVGLIGVVLARWVFVGRENRRIGRPQRWNDTLPLTFVAMLITGVIIMDRELGLSTAAFTGLGVGWAAVLILDVLGERVINMLRAGFAIQVPPEVKHVADASGHDGKMLDERNVPTDMMDSLEKIDRHDRENGNG